MKVDKITQRTLRSIKPLKDPGAKTYVMERGHNGLRGFGICIYPTTASYIARIFGRSHTIGPVDVIPLVKARALARTTLERLWSEHAATQRGEPVARRLRVATLAQLADRYTTDHARPHKKAISAKEDERMWTKLILPFETRIDPRDERSTATTLGKLTLPAITRDHLQALHLSLVATPIAANRVLALLSTAFGQAAEFDPPWFHGTNPTRGILRYPEEASTRRYSRDEYARIGAALRKAEQDQAFPLAAILAVQAIARSGARPYEIAGALVSEVDVEAGVIRRPHSKADRPGKKRRGRIIHVPRELLERAVALERPKECPYLFPGRFARQPIDAKFKRIVVYVKAEAQLPDFVLKALRHSYRSEAPEVQLDGVGAIPPEIAGRLLGHTTPEMGDTYMHTTASLEAKAAVALSQRVGGMLDAKPAEVVPFRSASAASSTSKRP